MAVGQGIYTTPAGVKEWYKQKYKGQNTLDMAVSAAEQQASAATAQTYLSEQAQKAAYQQQYESYVDQAYKSSLEQRSDILNSNLIAGSKKALLTENDAALSDAYNSYLATLQSGLSEVESNAAKQYASIDESVSSIKEQADKLLTSEAENITKGIDYAFDYLQAIGQYAEQQEGALEALYNDPNWSRYIEKYTEEGSDEPLYRMYNREQLSRPRIDLETGEQLGLYDSMGNLTKAGQDFFDQMLNFDWTDYGALKDMQSYGSFVAAKDNDFYQWLISNNQYAATPDAFGRNLNTGLLREAMGLESSDETYLTKERKSWTQEEKTNVQDMLFGALGFTTDEYKEFTSEYDISDYKYAAEVLDRLDETKLANLKSVYKTFGINDEALNKFIEEYTSYTKGKQDEKERMAKSSQQSVASVSKYKSKKKLAEDYVKILRNIIDFKI